jgi:hypothetical protein
MAISITLGNRIKKYLGDVTRSAKSTAFFGRVTKALGGDLVLAVSASITSLAHGVMNTTTTPVTVLLQDAAGFTHDWYNGPVKLAVATTSAAGVPAISPTAGDNNMTNGQLTVNLTGSGTWLAADTVTLTVSAPTGVPLLGSLATKTYVLTLS